METGNFIQSILHNVFIQCCETKLNLFDSFLETCHQWYERPAHSLNEIKLRENTKPKPLTIYGRLKYSSEKYILKKFKDKKNNYCIGRIFSFTDHTQKKTFLIPSVYEKIKISRNNKEIDFKDTNHNRDFSY